MKRRGRVVRRENTNTLKGQEAWYIWGGKSLLVSCLLTAALLCLLALGVLFLGLSEKSVSIGIIIIYVAVTFAGGFVAARKAPGRKFLWGLLVGLAYAFLLAILSVGKAGSASGLGDSFLTTMLLCGAGGMLGGMLG